MNPVPIRSARKIGRGQPRSVADLWHSPSESLCRQPMSVPRSPDRLATQTADYASMARRAAGAMMCRSANTGPGQRFMFQVHDLFELAIGPLARATPSKASPRTSMSSGSTDNVC
jgi:hypothetical protein